VDEMQLYTNVDWYWDASLEKEYPDIIRFHCETPGGLFSLYEIL
jgi:hypothetical protein